jgi:hypothetical protein
VLARTLDFELQTALSLIQDRQRKYEGKLEALQGQLGDLQATLLRKNEEIKSLREEHMITQTDASELLREKDELAAEIETLKIELQNKSNEYNQFVTEANQSSVDALNKAEERKKELLRDIANQHEAELQNTEKVQSDAALDVIRRFRETSEQSLEAERKRASIAEEACRALHLSFSLLKAMSEKEQLRMIDVQADTLVKLDQLTRERDTLVARNAILRDNALGDNLLLKQAQERVAVLEQQRARSPEMKKAAPRHPIAVANTGSAKGRSRRSLSAGPPPLLDLTTDDDASENAQPVVTRKLRSSKVVPTPKK